MRLFSHKSPPAPENAQEQFLRALYEKYATYLKRLAWSILQDEQEADDMVGEVFLHFVKNISRLEQYSCSQIKNYVVICTRGRSLNRLKKRQRSNENEKSLFDTFGEPLELEDQEPSIDLQVIKKMDLETASRLLEQVTPAYRDAFKLKYQMGLDDSSISQAIDIQPQSVKVYVRRAQNELRKLALERGIVHE